MDDISDATGNVIKTAVSSIMEISERESTRSSINEVFVTMEDFRRSPDYKKIVVVGCTGSGKSTLLNVLSGNKFIQNKTTNKWDWKEEPIFEANHSCNAVTQSMAYANIKWMGDGETVTVVDTIGHDDTSGNDIDVRENRDKLREQAADFHNKLKAMGSINCILLLHDHVSSNRLNPATYSLLRMIDEKFGPDIWNNVIVAYSQCNGYSESSWNSEIFNKKREFQSELKKQITGCNVDVPMICLGGGIRETFEDLENFHTGDYRTLLNFVKESDSFSTQDLQPFSGAQWSQYEKLVTSRDEAISKADAALNYVPVCIKLLGLITLLFWRSVVLPTWLSMCMLNIPFTMIDEFLIMCLAVVIIGPTKCKYCGFMFYEQWIKNTNIIGEISSVSKRVVEEGSKCIPKKTGRSYLNNFKGKLF